MVLYTLFGQRKETYHGEYGPEVLVCWDEFCVDENPEGWDEAVAEAEAKYAKEFISFRVIKVQVDGDMIRDILVKTPTVAGTVL